MSQKRAKTAQNNEDEKESQEGYLPFWSEREDALAT